MKLSTMRRELHSWKSGLKRYSHCRLTLFVHNIISLCVMVSLGSTMGAHTLEMPKEWRDICSLREFRPRVFSKYGVHWPKKELPLHLSCQVIGGGVNEAEWNFHQLRTWLSDVSDQTVFATIQCHNDGRISLPWPMRCPHLVGLAVNGCVITDQYSDFFNKNALTAKDYLRVLDIQNSIWTSKASAFDLITQPEQLQTLTSAYECGQDDSVEVMMYRNTSYRLAHKINGAAQIINDTGSGYKSLLTTAKDLDLNSSFLQLVSDDQINRDRSDNINADLVLRRRRDALSNFTTMFGRGINASNASHIVKTNGSVIGEIMDSIFAMKIQCKFKRLRVLQQSLTQPMPVSYFRMLVKGSEFPNLTSLNFSMAGFVNFPKQLQRYWDFFPRLGILDLSYNNIETIKFQKPLPKAKLPTTTLDLSFNNISAFSINDLQNWAAVDNLFVDLRNNPINCDVNLLSALQPVLESSLFFHGKMSKYEYVRHLSCFTPSKLRGFPLDDVYRTYRGCRGDSDCHFVDRLKLTACIRRRLSVGDNDQESTTNLIKSNVILLLIAVYLNFLFVYTSLRNQD